MRIKDILKDKTPHISFEVFPLLLVDPFPPDVFPPLLVDPLPPDVFPPLLVDPFPPDLWRRRRNK